MCFLFIYFLLKSGRPLDGWPATWLNASFTFKEQIGTAYAKIDGFTTSWNLKLL